MMNIYIFFYRYIDGNGFTSYSVNNTNEELIKL